MRTKIVLPKLATDLLKECKVSAFRASGSGGQHINVTDSAVRLIHLPTGITVTSQKERSQYLNKQECIEKLRKKVEKLNYRPPVRVPTQMSKTAKRKILDTKAKHSKKKQLRSRPPSDDA